MANSKGRQVELLSQYFEGLSDPRSTKSRKHKLTDLIVISVCAIISGAKGPTGIERWAKGKEEFLLRLLELPGGIPSRDSYRRLLIALVPEALQTCFSEWLAGCYVLRKRTAGEQTLVNNLSWLRRFAISLLKQRAKER